MPNIRVFRCTALPDDLDESDSVPRSHEHTRMLLDAYTLKELWDEYGVVGDLVVSAAALVLNISAMSLTSTCATAVHGRLPSRRYSRALVARPSPSGHQGNIQGSPRRVDTGVHHEEI